MAAACLAPGQPALAPCIASSESGGALRLVFRAPTAPAARGARIVLLLRLARNRAGKAGEEPADTSPDAD